MTDAEFKERVMEIHGLNIEDDEFTNEVREVCDEMWRFQESLQSFADDCESCKL